MKIKKISAHFNLIYTIQTKNKELEKKGADNIIISEKQRL